MLRRVAAATAVLVGWALVVPPVASPVAVTAPVTAIRVDQVGYPSDGPKVAYLMSGSDLTGVGFAVKNASGGTVEAGVAGPTTGRWNARYPYVAPLDFTALTAPGSYVLAVAGPVPTSSPRFTVAPAPALWHPALTNALSFYQNERDGPAYVPSALRAAPAHLDDEAAMTYRTPVMRGNGRFAGDLTPLGVTVDASGGWWDAGDYLEIGGDHLLRRGSPRGGGPVLPRPDGRLGRTVGLPGRGALR